MTEDRRTVDRGLWTVDGRPYATICHVVSAPSLEHLVNVLMIMRRIVLESSTIKKRMLIS